MSVQSHSSSESEILPAVMLAMLLAVTGLEVGLLVAPHKVIAHPVKTAMIAALPARH